MPSSPRHLLCHFLFLVSMFASGFAPAAGAEEPTWTDPEQNLSVTLAGGEDWQKIEIQNGGQLQAGWSGRIGSTSVRLFLVYLDRDAFSFDEPKDVLDNAAYNLPSDDPALKGKNGMVQFAETAVREGAYGYVPAAWIGSHHHLDGTKEVRQEFHLCGLTRHVGYKLELTCDPALVPADREAVLEFLWGAVKYDGPVRDPNWTDEEVAERWKRDAPPKVQEDSKLVVLRTRYYLILTNVGKGTAKSFGEKLDENYEIIRGVYPFEDAPAQRLLPVFYFITTEQYHDWCERVLGNRNETSAGIATGDVYATYHQSANAPVHIHEATHQIFKNRLGLGGGGSWFQEGVAEYMSEQPNDLNSIKRLVKDGKYKPFREFMTIKSLLRDADTERVDGGSDSHESYIQAAAIIEFVRHSDFGREKFQDFIHAVGAVPRGNLSAIEGALQKSLGVDIAGFEKEFQQYWLKRKRRKELK
ncbi:MAG: hypothetical protein R3F17_03080 [Planctomycetota bacterium]